MESMNEDANIVKEPSKLVTYLVVAAKVRLYTFDAGIYRNVGSCLHKTYLFF